MHKKRFVVSAGVAIVLAAVIALAWLQGSLAIRPAEEKKCNQVEHGVYWGASAGPLGR
jgi:hypothetical protein